MNADLLFKRLTNREDMQEIPIKYLIMMSIAVLEELPECLEEEKNEQFYELQ